MPVLPTSILATSIKSFTRSVLFAAGIDHMLADFLACSAIRAGGVLFSLLRFAIPRRPSADPFGATDPLSFEQVAE